MLSFVGWINAITATIVLVSGAIFGVFCIYKSKTKHARLLIYLGIAAICAGLGFLGPFCDFLSILFTGKNLDNSYGQISKLSFFWLPITVTTALYLGSQLLIPSKKWYILGLFTILGILFEIFIFFDPNSFSFVYPDKSGEDLIDDSVNFFSPAGILTLIFAISALILLGFGFLYQGLQLEGKPRHRFFSISIGMFMYIVFAALDGLTTPGLGLIIVRIPQMVGFWLMYYGLKERG
ncbi:MAG: hypothetical protein GF353_27960 [Candidatus Lokiarchaeota archaeon]|nr:hypothetical protein [Candidatus Lokiarchaeota archaeon]